MTDIGLHALLELEHAGWQALCEGRGGAYYRRVMSEDGTMILVNGMTLDREASAEALDAAESWDSYEIRDPRVLSLGPDAALLIYAGSASRKGQPPFTAIMTSAYRREHGELRLAAYQQTAAEE
ncbi:nuclear transport factor 2 family protein [Agromyces silvae]|uniref:nuclear transport factor 2 family protein n=1 Tax=Agromyces silvae TaxID=3388266 RepID=UPI00280A85CC|nr:nuclear transport factor 2 family protein [Agromyces protaetiae]